MRARWSFHLYINYAYVLQKPPRTRFLVLFFFSFVKVQRYIFFLLVTRVNYFSPLQLHKWQNSAKLSAVWRILLQWRYLSPGPWHQPAFLSVSPCIMAERGKYRMFTLALFFLCKFSEQNHCEIDFCPIQEMKTHYLISSGKKLSGEGFGETVWRPWNRTPQGFLQIKMADSLKVSLDRSLSFGTNLENICFNENKTKKETPLVKYCELQNFYEEQIWVLFMGDTNISTATLTCNTVFKTCTRRKLEIYFKANCLLFLFFRNGHCPLWLNWNSPLTNSRGWNQSLCKWSRLIRWG